jgi:uncharacterized protein YacL (UPF0231 family)
MKINLYHDAYDFPRAEVDVPHAVLGWFLEQDVQSSLPWCRELVETIENIQAGRASHWEGTGNAHTLIMSGKGVRIDNEYVDPPQSCELSLPEFKRAVQAWLKCIQDAHQKPIQE